VVYAYQVKIADGPNCALDDLKELSDELCDELYTVMLTELRDDPDPRDADEGVLDRRIRWRRGITHVDRRTFAYDEYEATTLQQAFDFVILYRKFTPTEVVEAYGQPGYTVLKILPNTALATMILRRAGLLDEDEGETD
jgi:hypothetical protein